MSVRAVSLIDVDLGRAAPTLEPFCSNCHSPAPSQGDGWTHVIGPDGVRRAQHQDRSHPSEVWQCDECGCSAVFVSLAEQADQEERDRSGVADERLEDMEIEEERWAR